MAGKYVIGSLAGSFAIAYVCDTTISERKLFGGTVSNKEWLQETDKMFQAWPCTAGPPIVVNPISHQNFNLKPHFE
ncbi:hypothetical protein FEM48_Zijuj02G0193400 [Ziziphus jujuba var. spinosa]|uniref:Uncharacterized protein n=1 Tax=Ziziphus jujuba var. spinosa TaxID=714518 RepID=A0A978VXI2_ZIZJJ|nr:hypothetical protein FEM48_Zijuj02G0193400 [Ziziphus jujuba var. spinosa]